MNIQYFTAIVCRRLSPAGIPRNDNLTAGASSQTLTRPSLWALLVVMMATAAQVGCAPDVSLHDNIDVHLDFVSVGQAKNRLHSPYVRGTQFTVSARGEDVPRNVRIISTNEDVLRPTRTGISGRRQSFKAVAEGRTAFRALDGGESLRRGSVAVQVANSASLHFHGDVLLGTDTAENPVETPQILVGGTATFLVRYYRDDVRLHGVGVLSVDPPEGTSWRDPRAPYLRDRPFHGTNDLLDVRVKQSHLGEDREWLEISPIQAGEYTVELRADGEPVGAITIRAVTKDEVEAIALRKRDESRLSRGDQGLVLAEAFDIDGNPIYGLKYVWDVDGRYETSVGDLYKYKYDGRHPVTLCALFNNHESVTQIHGIEGHVASTNQVGCSTGQGAPLPGPVLGFLLLGIGYWRRYLRKGNGQV